MYTQNIIIIVILILLSILLFISTNKPTNEQFQDTNTDYNINPPTKTIEHPDYGIIKCISNDKYVCGTILNGGVWEKDLFEQYFKPYITENTTVLDCGAYIGSHTILMKRLNRNNDIFVFEMMPEHYKIIQDNINLNNFDNILTFNFALGEKIGRIKLPNIDYINQYETNYGGIGINYDLDNVHGILHNIKQNLYLKVDVQMINLDFILPFIVKPVSFMKVDVEGNEINLLRGAKELITKYKPIIEIEIWNNKYNDFISSDIWTYLQLIGYKIKNAINADYLIYY
jgi:FkbM family methyltransferase